MKQLLIFTSLVLVFAALCCFIPTRADMQIYSGVVRLHVLANSDSEKDQRIKLLVRDAVLSDIESITSGASSAEEASAKIADNVGNIRELVRATLSSLGEDVPAAVTLSEEYYPERSYGDVSFPSGKYTSLKIMLGEASGQNWWCVLYPAVCTSGAKASSVLLQSGFSTEQINILTDEERPVYKIKFKLLEFLGSAFS